MLKAKSAATKRTAVLSGMPRGGGAGNPTELGAMRIGYAQEALDAIKSEIEQMRAELKPLIEALDVPLLQQAMTMRYMEGYSVRDIAYKLNYSEQHIFRTVNRGEKKINKDES